VGMRGGGGGEGGGGGGKEKKARHVKTWLGHVGGR